MFMDSPALRNYLYNGLEAAPVMLESMLAGLTPEQADRRPDPERFSIREMLAHLADMEEVFLARMRRIRQEDQPTITSIDPGPRAIERNYAAADPAEQLRLFTERRAETLAFLKSLADEEWGRTAVRPDMGTIALEAHATIIPLHDLYHLRQVEEWLKAG